MFIKYLFLLLSLVPLCSFSEPMSDNEAFNEYEDFFLYLGEVIKDRESTIDSDKCKSARRKLRGKVEEIKSKQENKKFWSTDTIKNALKYYDEEKESITNIAYSRGDESKTCSRNKPYKNPNNLISKCLDLSNNTDQEVVIMCDCLEIEKLHTLAQDASGIFSSQTESMKTNGISVRANEYNEMELVMSPPLNELPFTKNEKDTILREKLYSSLRSCVSESDESSKVQLEFNKKIKRLIRPCGSEIKRIQKAINKKYSIHNYIEKSPSLSKVKNNMKDLSPALMKVEQHCYKSNDKTEAILTLFDKISEPHPNYFVKDYCEDTLKKEKNTFFTTENFLQPSWSTTSDRRDITGSSEVDKYYKDSTPLIRGSESLIAGKKLGDYNANKERWRIRPRAVKTLRVGGFTSSDEEEGNTISPEDYFPNIQAYGKVSYNTDTVNMYDKNKTSPNQDISFWEGKLEHLKRRKKKLKYYDDITRTAAFKEVFFACDPKSFLRNFPGMAEHFSISDACSPENYSWYSFSSPPKQCELINLYNSSDRMGENDPDGYYFDRDAIKDPSHGARER